MSSIIEELEKAITAHREAIRKAQQKLREAQVELAYARGALSEAERFYNSIKKETQQWKH